MSNFNDFKVDFTRLEEHPSQAWSYICRALVYSNMITKLVERE